MIDHAAPEPPLEPNLPICDAHHHLWDRPSDPYLLPDYLADIDSGHNIVSSVFVECVTRYDLAAPAPLQPVGETRFADAAGVEATRLGRPGICAGIVCFADLTSGAAAGDVLDAQLAASPRVRGVRHCATWDASAQVRNAHTDPVEGLLNTPDFLAGFAELDKRGLSFDAWVFHPQLDDVAQLARTFPDIVIMLDHLGGPLGIGPYAGRRQDIVAEWRRRLSRVAALPNVMVKLGGLLMPLNGWALHKRAIPPRSVEVANLTCDYFRHAIDSFGIDRCLFESNYPADRPSLPYATLWNVFKRVVADGSAADKAALFHDNAVRAYRLDRVVPGHA